MSTTICGFRYCDKGPKGGRKVFRPKRKYPPQKYCSDECGDGERHARLNSRRSTKRKK